MREIKFRAWDGKKMLYGFGYIRSSDGVAVTWSEDTWEEWKVMQYTGLKDKNGKEIYEGDIVRYMYWNNNYTNAVVKWEEVSGSDDMGIDMIGFPDFSSGEIIGNIYENPELEVNPKI